VESTESGRGVEHVAIDDREFELFRNLIHEATGIALSNQKRQLLCSRLAKRLRHHGLRSFTEYYEFLRKRDPARAEQRILINCVTTNKTEFFRESHHFDFLRSTVVAELQARVARGEPRKLRIWSAGCSTGEEPYTIAMLLADSISAISEWDIKILASDIDTDVLDQAANGVYTEHLTDRVPATIRRFAFEPYGEHGAVRVRRELRDLIKFRQINLIAPTWPIRTHFDVIFCRNVTIYFNRATQRQVYEHFSRYLQPDGYFIAGHSENLSWLPQLFTAAGNTIYRLNPELAAKRSVAPRHRSLPPAARPRSRRPPAAASARAPSQRPAGRVRPKSLRPPPIPSLSPSSQHPAAGSKLLGSSYHSPVIIESTPVSRLPSKSPSRRPPASPSLAANEIVLEPHVKRARIQSGEVWSSEQPSLVSTVLGSCVAACLFDPIAAVGGMNHFMLPEAPEGSLLAASYGSNAMELLINQLLKAGARRDRLKAKLFGGAHVLKNSDQGHKVAESNAAFAKEYLERESIAVLAQRLGGTNPLLVNFFTHTGKVLLRTIQGKAATIGEKELRYYKALTKKISQPPPSGDVTLF
jgi:chemotaxis protein methyltransferase CheR